MLFALNQHLHSWRQRSEALSSACTQCSRFEALALANALRAHLQAPILPWHAVTGRVEFDDLSFKALGRRWHDAGHDGGGSAQALRRPRAHQRYSACRAGALI